MCIKIIEECKEWPFCFISAAGHPVQQAGGELGRAFTTEHLMITERTTQSAALGHVRSQRGVGDDLPDGRFVIFVVHEAATETELAGTISDVSHETAGVITVSVIK